MGEGALDGGDNGGGDDGGDGGGDGGDGGDGGSDGRRSWQMHDSKSELELKSALKCFDES